MPPSGNGAGAGSRRKAAKTILSLDPPDHTRLRRLVSLAFTPTAIAALRPGSSNSSTMPSTQQSTVAGWSSSTTSRPVPFQVISDLLDMPTDRAAEREWSRALTAGLEPTADLAEAEAAEAASDLMGEYVGQIIEERRRNPGDDLLSALIAVEAAGDRLCRPSCSRSSSCSTSPVTRPR
ncbi:MAG: hypothetical protein R2705_11915 [Ilumatobacteraceae bacterium]